MRICHIVDGLMWTGGVQEYVANLAKAQMELGHDVTVLCSGNPARHVAHLNRAAETLNIEWHPTRRVLGRFSVPIGMARSIRRQARSADVVHAHRAFFPGTWMAVFSRARLVVTCYLHPADLTRPRQRVRRALLKLLIRRSHLIVCVSAAELSLLTRLRTPRHACVVWPGLESSAASDRPREQLVLAVGRLSVDKGIDTLLPACGIVAQQLSVAVVGPAVDPHRSNDLISRSSLPTTCLRGDVSDAELDDLFAVASVFVSASRQESFGIAVLKAIAAGCSPVLSDIASHREIVTTLGIDPACLFPLDSTPEEVAERILVAAGGGPVAVPGRDRIPTWVSSAATLVGHYSEVLARPTRRAASIDQAQA